MGFLSRSQGPIVQTQPPVVRIGMRVSVQDVEGAVSGTLTLEDEARPPIDGRMEGPQVVFDFPADVPYGWGAWLAVWQDDRRMEKRVTLAPDLTVTLPRRAVFLPPLERRGAYYYRDGQPFFVLMSSDFRLYERFLNRDPSVEGVLQDRKNLGFNCLRVWLLNTSVGHVVPGEHPDFYDRLPEFIGLCGLHGLYLELTVFTQAKTLLPTIEQQQAHYDRTVAALGNRFVFLEGANEYPEKDNGFDPRLNLHKPAGSTFDLAFGSGGADGWLEPPQYPVRDSLRYHSNDLDQWPRRLHNLLEMSDKYQVPAIANENTRPDRDGDTQHHFDAAACSALLGAGYCFHSQAGKQSVVFADGDMACAKATVAGAQSVDLNQRTFPYEHPSGLEGGDIIRAYKRGSAVVLIHWRQNT